MGPRTSVHGEALVPIMQTMTKTKLQWGRGPASTESPIASSKELDTGMALQWGRGPASTERGSSPS